MIELVGLSDPVRGRRFILTRLPATVGRSPDNDLVVDGPGVWDRHVRFELDAEAGVRVRVLGPNARLWVEDRLVQETILRAGDCLTLGGLTFRFVLTPLRPQRRNLCAAQTWLLIGLTLVLQAILLWPALESFALRAVTFNDGNAAPP